jgi:hypothetical protein
VITGNCPWWLIVCGPDFVVQCAKALSGVALNCVDLLDELELFEDEAELDVLVAAPRAAAPEPVELGAGFDALPAVVPFAVVMPELAGVM